VTDARSGPRILLATDGSSYGEDAEGYAYCLAALWQATLTVLTVLEFPPGLNPDAPVNRLYLEELMKQATAHLADLRARAANRGISLHTRLATGIPSEELLAAAQAEDSDLIVVGTKGKTGLEHVLLGSTAERVIRTAPCPVLAVRSHRRDQSGGRPDPCRGVTLSRLLVPVDFSDCSLDALEYALLFARRAGASIRLLHVLEPVCYGLDFTLPHATKSERLREQMNKRLSDLAVAISDSGVTAHVQLRGGLPSDSILDSARTEPADLIVMGTHGRRGLSHALSGSVAEAVLRKATCPVLTVRSPKFGPGHRRVVSTETSHAATT
jgi:nucleotide-binding universal stress UspA family protein